MGVTVRGLEAFTAGLSRLPAGVTAALKGVAHDTAHDVADDAKTNLRSKTHGTGKLANSIHVTEHADKKKFTVEVPGGDGEDPMLGVYLEYGTKKMEKRQFLRPARDAHDARYRRDMASAARKAFTDLFK